MAARLLVVMGVCGCGKSTVGSLLAKRLGIEFVEGDELHPPANVMKMAAGEPLDDADRYDWLLALAAVLHRATLAGQSLVLSCSALKRDYRDVLRSASESAGAVRFVYLQGDHALFARRMEQRSGHYMPASLLRSQFAILEPPGADEQALAMDARLSVDAIVGSVCRALGTGASSTSGTRGRGQQFPA